MLNATLAAAASLSVSWPTTMSPVPLEARPNLGGGGGGGGGEIVKYRSSKTAQIL